MADTFLNSRENIAQLDSKINRLEAVILRLADKLPKEHQQDQERRQREGGEDDGEEVATTSSSSSQKQRRRQPPQSPPPPAAATPPALSQTQPLSLRQGGKK